MSSWFSAWLPSFNVPTINLSLPSSLQTRFISFILKKTLGHLLAPGQLDLGQIESQIGSGYVQINDLELNNEAINSLIPGLPITLHDGFISSATAKIPWPNPLTSTLGCSLDSLHLTFYIRAKEQGESLSSLNLAESVVSVAESFVHNELAPQEEASLMSSIHRDILPETPHLPGSLDHDNPFTVSLDEEETQIPASLEVDPSGVSVFATMVERLLARFEFDASNTKITLVHPGNMSFTISILKISYRGNSEGDAPSGSPEGSRLKHSVIISELKITARSLRFPKPSSSVQTWTPTRQSSGPGSSSSSLDEETQMMMSQSLAFLPPRSLSPADSVSSSLYESAVSDVRSSARDHFDTGSGMQEDSLSSGVQDTARLEEEIILSFGRSPIKVQLVLSSSENGREQLELDISLGVLASAIRAEYLRGITNLLSKVSEETDRPNSGLDPRISSATKSSTSRGPDIHVTVSSRGFVLLLPLDSMLQTSHNDEPPKFNLLPFYESPLVPPAPTSSYYRLHIDSLHIAVSKTTGSAPAKTPPTSDAWTSLSQATLKLSVDDLSIFYVSRDASSDERFNLLASPVLIIDPHLSQQYFALYHHPESREQCQELPHLEVLDWTNLEHQRNGLKPSFWRTRLTGRVPKGVQQSEGQITPAPAISISVVTTVNSEFPGAGATNIDMQSRPLHFFLDLASLLKAQTLAFVGEVMQGLDPPPSTPPLPGVEVDSYMEHDIHSHSKPLSRKAQRAGGEPGVQLSLHVPNVRVQIRAPPPPCEDTRSGALVIDLHTILLTNSPRLSNQQTRFEFNSLETGRKGLENDPHFLVEIGRAILACSSANESSAPSMLSIGCLPLSEGPITEDGRLFDPLKPVLKVTKRFARNDNANAYSFEIPSIYLDIWKSVLDDVQYWIDDVSQLFDRTFNPNAIHDSKMQVDDVEANLVGSRYFARSRGQSVSSSTVSGEQSEKIINLIVSEAMVRVNVPRPVDQGSYLFFLAGSDISLSVGTQPDETNEETGINAQVTNLSLEMSDGTSTQRLFSMTSPRSISSPNRPMLSLRFSSISLPGSALKESIVEATLSGFTVSIRPDFSWTADVTAFIKSPPGTFESVIPSERTRVGLTVFDGSVQFFAGSHSGSFVAYLDGIDLKTDLSGNAPDSVVHLNVAELKVLLLDDVTVPYPAEDAGNGATGVSYWNKRGFASVGEMSNLLLTLKLNKTGGSIRVVVEDVSVRILLCADTADALSVFLEDFTSSLQPVDEQRIQVDVDDTPVVSTVTGSGSGLMGSIDDLAFRKLPEIGPAPDMIEDDLPTNANYLDESFGAAGGLRELRDEDFDDFGDDDDLHVENLPPSDGPGVISRVGGETIRMVHSAGVEVIEDFFQTLPPEPEEATIVNDTSLSVRLRNGDITLALYEGYDWLRTRKTIEDEAKAIRKRLTKIRQLVASGQAYHPSSEETGALLFNSVYVGLDMDELEPTAMLAAIDEELREDVETTSQSSWQTLRPANAEKPQSQSTPKRRKLVRSKGPSMEFKFLGANAEFDRYRPGASMINRTLVTIKDMEILDHIKTSTWKKFLTSLRADSQGNIRESGSDMVRVELRTVCPVAGDLSEEVRLRAKILPLRLYVDQDAVDFLKKFFSFKMPGSPETVVDKTPSGTYLQLAEVFPIDLKLDYKPRRVDYKALREGRTIELMNFFHFDGAEMTLRHITLYGITGWGRLFELLNDLWTPDVKATQLADVISGVSPIRSVVNVGSGMADLVLLPIAQYRKDGRIVRGVQKGATAFMKSTAMEAIKLGSRLATGTQVILEQAEGVLGNQFDQPLTTETIAGNYLEVFAEDSDEDIPGISKYAQQPADVKEGVQHAYRSLRKNLSSAAQTILAIPMEVYERSGNEGAVRSVIRAVPIAVLRPMIGASEAVSKTLQGLHNTLDPEIRHENEEKYKRR